MACPESESVEQETLIKKFGNRSILCDNFLNMS